MAYEKYRTATRELDLICKILRVKKHDEINPKIEQIIIELSELQRKVKELECQLIS
jgi:hypothetical protein